MNKPMRKAVLFITLIKFRTNSTNMRTITSDCSLRVSLTGKYYRKWPNLAPAEQRSAD